MSYRFVGQVVVAAAVGAVSGAVAALGPAETARRALVTTDHTWWHIYRRALIALGEDPTGFDPTPPTPFDTALTLALIPSEAELAFRILTDPDPDPDPDE